MADALVVGGSVAALVATDTIASQGRPVRLLLPAKGVGSGFLPLTVGSRRLELGPRLIELAYDDPPGDPPPLADYRPGPHGHRPYLALIDRYVRGLAGDDLVPVARPEITLGQVRVADFLLSGDLAEMPWLLSGDDLTVIAAQAADAAARMGPAGLLASDRELDLWTMTYRDASIANHGQRFHERFIEPIAAKILDGGSGSVVAALRRRVWLPLFWPQTLADACTGRLTYRPARPMHTLEPGGMGALVERLLARLQTTPLVRIHEVPALHTMTNSERGVMLTFADGSVDAAHLAVVGLPPEEVFAAAGIDYRPAKVPLSVAWVDAREEDVLACPSVLWVADPDVPVYRISENRAETTPGRRTFCVELHHAVPEPLLEKAAVEALWALGLVRNSARCRLVRAGVVSAFAVPSVEGVERFAAARSAFDAFGLPITLVGASAAFLCDSFNEQIVQGMVAAG